MHVPLLVRSGLISRSKMRDVLRAAVLRQISDVLGKCIPGFCQLSIEQKGGLPSYVAFGTTTLEVVNAGRLVLIHEPAF